MRESIIFYRVLPLAYAAGVHISTYFSDNGDFTLPMNMIAGMTAAVVLMDEVNLRSHRRRHAELSSLIDDEE